MDATLPHDPLLLHWSQRFAQCTPGACLVACHVLFVPFRREDRVEEDFNGRWESVVFLCSLAMPLWFKEFHGAGAIASGT